MQKYTSTYQALYTPRQELIINTISVITDGTIRSDVASETTDCTI